MLDEFILEQLGSISRRKEELGKQLKELTDEEDGENARMNQLLHMDDVGKEIFSPRGSSEPLKTKIDNIRKNIDELLLKEARIKDELERTASKEEKYREMLAEAQNGSLKDDIYDAKERLLDQNTATRHRQELEMILKKLRECIEYSRVDRGRCTTELSNLEYYVKALLSKA